MRLLCLLDRVEVFYGLAVCIIRVLSAETSGFPSAQIATRLCIGLRCLDHAVFWHTTCGLVLEPLFSCAVQTTTATLCQSSNVSVTRWNLVERVSTPDDLAPVLIRNHPTFEIQTQEVRHCFKAS